MIQLATPNRLTGEKGLGPSSSTKRCPRCGEVKTLDQFYRRSRSPSGRSSWCKKCQDKHKANYYQVNHDRIVAVGRSYYLKSRDKILAKEHEETLQRKMLLVAYYSNNTNKCACCSESDIRFLSIGHINGGGNQHRKKIGCASGKNFYCWLIKAGMPEGYQVLCYNCNLARAFYGICPHESSKEIS